VSSGISSLKPAKTHTGAFPGSSRSQLDRKPSVVQTSWTVKQERTHGQTASLRSQVELRDHSRNRRSQPLCSAAPPYQASGSALWAQEGHQLPQVNSRPLPLLQPDLTGPHPFRQSQPSSSFESSLRPGPGSRLVSANHGGQGWNTLIGQVQVM